MITSFRVKKLLKEEFESLAEFGIIVNRYESDVGNRNGVVVAALAIVVADVENLVVRVAFLGAEL